MTSLVRSRRWSFAGSQGVELAARWDEPQTDAVGIVLLSHCFTCTKDLKLLARLARRLAARGWACLRFDMTGLGDSGGDFASTNFSTNVSDILAAADALRRVQRAPAVMLGHSLGGAATLAAARHVPECRCVVTLAAPSDTSHLGQTLRQLNPEIGRTGQGTVTLGGKEYSISPQLLDDLQSYRLEHDIPRLGRPLLVLHSPQDRTVGVQHAYRLWELAREPKSIFCLDGADHLFAESRRDIDDVAEIVNAWARRYVGASVA